MKFSDIIIETKKQQLTEKPMGFLKTMGNKVASTFGSGQAQGRLDTGKEANTLRKDFDVFLGKTGQNPTGDLVLQFLKQKGYPTKSAQNFISAGKPQAAPAADPAATAKPAAPADDQTKPAATPGATTPPTDAPEKSAAPAQPTKDEIAARVKANVGKSAAANKASGFGQPVEKPKPDAGAGVFGQMAQQLSNPQEKPAAPAATIPPATDTPATPPARTQGGGKVAGQLSQTPGAIAKRQARAVKKRTGHPADDNPNIQLGTESIEHFQQMIESRVSFYLLLEEVLSGKQLDQIFLAAAQEKAKGGGTTPAAAGSGATAADPAGAPVSQPQSGATAAPNDSQFMKQAAAAYDGMRGAGLGATKFGQDEVGKSLKDTSGRIPDNILGQINGLTNKQRAQLRKELDKA
jgi:hypothetical protein